ncbi:MAG: anti-sigma factor family protein [Phycisphaerales bacterium JB039]
MSERGAIWNDLPARIDEHALLAWVEDRLEDADRREVEAALRARPALLGRLEAMRMDRETLAGLGDERAPAQLMDSIEQTLERDALLGLADGRDLLRSAPISTVVVRRRSPVLARVGRGLALAALVAIAAGAAAWFGPQLLKPAPAPAPVGPMAQRAPEPAPEPEIALPGVIDDGMRLAAAPDPLEVSPVELPGPATMGLDEALALAAQGRLAIRVKSETFDLASLRMAQLAERPSVRDAGWRVRRDGDERAVALLPTPDQFGPEVASFDPGAMAAGSEPAPAAHGPEVIGPRMAPQRIGRSYIASFALTEASLERLLDQLSVRCGSTPALEALESPLWLDGPVSADAILWWGAGADAVGLWAAAPVVLEPAR